MSFKRFYTYPPIECNHPWILRNIKQKPIPCSHEIVDIGIYDLLKPPFKHSREKLEKWELLETSGWKVVPDCPDLRGEFDIHGGKDNLKYSWELLVNHYNPYDDSHLPVIQSYYENLDSFKSYIHQFKDKFGTPEKIAIGSICKADNHDVGVKMLKLARREFPESWIHAFGLRFQQFKRAYHLIDSFDSTSWTFPRNSGRGSCRNKEERVQFFHDYMRRVDEVTFPISRGQGVLV
jgi:hypothetical protein